MPTRNPAPKSARRGSWLLALALLALVTTPAAAQERIERVALPDHELDMPLGRVPGSDSGLRARLLWDIAGSFGATPGQEDFQALGHARLRWGVRASRSSSLAMRSELALANTGPDSLTGPIEGRHDAVAYTLIHDSRGDLPSLQITAHGRFHHLGHRRLALATAGLGPGAHTDAALALSVAPGRTDKGSGADRGGIALPLGASWRRIGYQGSGMGQAVRWTDSLGISGGVGASLVDKDIVRMAFTIIGARMELTKHHLAMDATSPVPAAPASPTTLTGNIHIANLDIVVAASDAMVSANGWFGWTGMRQSRQGITESTAHGFAFQAGVTITGEGNTAGLGAARTGMPSADGSRLLFDSRVEVHAGWLRRTHGGTVRAAVSWLSDPRDDATDIIDRAAISTELFWRLPARLYGGNESADAPDGIALGIYQLAAYDLDAARGTEPPAWDPWLMRRGGSLELGGFVRWSAEL